MSWTGEPMDPLMMCIGIDGTRPSNRPRFTARKDERGKQLIKVLKRGRAALLVLGHNLGPIHRWYFPPSSCAPFKGLGDPRSPTGGLGSSKAHPSKFRREP